MIGSAYAPTTLSASSILLHAIGFALSTEARLSTQDVSRMSINTTRQPRDLCGELSYRRHHVDGAVIRQGIARKRVEYGFGGTLHERLPTSFLDRSQTLDAVLRHS